MVPTANERKPARGLAALAAATALLAGAALPAAAGPEERSEFEAAWALYTSGEPSQEAFERVYGNEANPPKDRFNAAYVLGVQTLGANDPEQALAWLNRAESILPGRPQVALRRTDALVHLGRLEKAGEEYRAVHLEEDASEAVRMRHALTGARLLHARGESDVAIEELVRLAEAHPGEWEPFYLMGLVYESFDIPDDALRAYARTIENDPGRDPFPGIYAYQRWAALSISTDPNSYQDKALKTVAIARYRVFLERAEANGVPEALVEQAEQAVSVLENFGA